MGFFILEQLTHSSKNVNFTVVSPHDKYSNYTDYWGPIKVVRFKYFYPVKYQKVAYEVIANLRSSFVSWLQLPFFILSYFLKTIAIYRKSDIIHAHWLLSGLIAVIVARFNSIPIILTIRGTDFNLIKNNIIMLSVAKWIINNVDIVTTVSYDLQKKISKITDQKVLTIPNGVDRNLFKPRDQKKCRKQLKLELNKKYILFVGMIRKEKGIYDLIEAYRIADLINTDLLLVGGGSKKEINALNTVISNIELEDKIHHYEHIDHRKISVWYNAVDVLVLPSYMEGKPNVIIEAMACGKPVIATNVGGIPEIVHDGKNGFLVEPKDIITLSEKIECCINNPSLIEDMANKSLDQIELLNLTWESNATEFTHIYNQIV